MLKAIAIAIAALLSCPAYAAPCSDRATIAANLVSKYNEHAQGAGIANETHIIELWLSRNGESFTILITDATGLSCLIAVGKNWQVIAQPKGEGL